MAESFSAFPRISYCEISQLAAIPINNRIDDNEAKQTFAIMCYSHYHYQCLQNVFNDTMSNTIRKLMDTLSNVKDDAYNAVYSRIIDIVLADLSPQEIVDLLIENMGNYPKPVSMEKYTDFMKNEYSVGSVLESLANDWIVLREVG